MAPEVLQHQHYNQVTLVVACHSLFLHAPLQSALQPGVQAEPATHVLGLGAADIWTAVASEVDLAAVLHRAASKPGERQFV